MVTVMKKYRHLTYQLSAPPCAPFNCCREKVNEKIIWQVNQYQFKVRRKKLSGHFCLNCLTFWEELIISVALNWAPVACAQWSCSEIHSPPDSKSQGPNSFDSKTPIVVLCFLTDKGGKSSSFVLQWEELSDGSSPDLRPLSPTVSGHQDVATVWMLHKLQAVHPLRASLCASVTFPPLSQTKCAKPLVLL